MEGEAIALVKLLSWLLPSMTYARYASSSTRPGILRLLTLIPVIVPLPFLPFFFSTLHLRIISACFLVWLTSFKLLLLSFDVGPLSSSLPLSTFLAVSSLPVKLRNINSPPNLRILLVPSAIKLVIFFSLVSSYQYMLHQLHPHALVLVLVQCVHLYLTLNLVLASTAILVGIFLGLEVEPQFDAPFKSTSLQDFWGRRWNLMVTSILKSLVYHPVYSRWGRLAAFLATFGVSGLVHEVVFYYLTLSPPTGEAFCFFMLHGICTAAEVGMRRKGWWDPRPAVGTPMTLGFVAVTALWLFFPPIVRTGTDRIVLEECEAMVRFFVDVGRSSVRRLCWNVNES